MVINSKKKRYKDLKPADREKRVNRQGSTVIIMFLIFSVIIGKLIYLQVFNYDYYRARANDERHKVISYNAPRGYIYDANGEVLAKNKQGFKLIFTTTGESSKKFYDTMGEVFRVLDENEEVLTESFPLKVDPVRFEFNVPEESINWSKARFMKDRGFESDILKKMFKGKNLYDLTKEETKELDNELVKYDAEYSFRFLIKKYRLYNLIRNEYSDEEWKEAIGSKESVEKLIDKLIKEVDNEEIRRYMVVKDKVELSIYDGYRPIVVSNDLDVNTAYIFEQIQMELPGISILKGPIRDYPQNDLASNIIGYIGKIQDRDKEKFEEKGYDIHEDYIGKSGIEEAFESYLKGTRGEESIEINKSGRKVKSLGEKPATPGDSVYLTIDSKVQKAAEKALDKTMEYMRELGQYKSDMKTLDDVDKSNATRGAAVVIDVKSGKILALASRPGMDLNLFTVQGRLEWDKYREIFRPDLEAFGKDYIEKHKLYEMETFKEFDMAKMTVEERKQFLLEKIFMNQNGYYEDVYDIYPKASLNYATKSSVPPGSIFKILTAVAGLEENVITGVEKIYDRGPYTKRYANFTGASWMYNLSRGSHGNQDVKEAIRDSNNYFFFEVADRLYEKGGPGSKESLDMIGKYAWKYGLGANMESPSRVVSTGLEIDHAFGQVYYYDSGKRYHSTIHTRNLYEYLEKGTSSIWVGEYKGIDIIPDRSIDSDEIYIIKKELTNEIKFQMNSENPIDLSEIDAIIGKLLEQMAKEGYEDMEYRESDIERMKKAIGSSINDARTEIISAVNLYNASIGQGINRFTPIQMANYIATLVNGGYRYKVHLVDKIVDFDGNIIEDFNNNNIIMEETGTSQKTIDIVKEGMRMVTSTPRGTAYKTFGNFPISNGGKTGSATFNDKYQADFGRTSFATYVGFAPFENPEIAVSVVIFDGGHGGYSARVARGIYEEYFKEQILEIDPEHEFMFEDK